MNSKKGLVLFLFILFLAASVPLAFGAEKAKPVEEFAADVVQIGTGRPASSAMKIIIDRWSTDEEKELLHAAFTEKGQDGLLKALQSTKRIGFLNFRNSLGYVIHYSSEKPGEDGSRRIILITDRNVNFWEARNNFRTMDYPFTLIELRLDKFNKGEGKMSIATKIALNKESKLFELEDWGTAQTLLLNVRSLQKPN
jgi:hypothetical protein